MAVSETALAQASRFQGATPMGMSTNAEPASRPGRRPEPGRRPPLRIVPPPESRARRLARRRARITTFVLVALTFGVMFVSVSLRIMQAQDQVNIDSLESAVNQAQTDNQRLRLEVARLESPQRIVDEARARLGMVPPATVTYLAAVPTPDTPPPST